MKKIFSIGFVFISTILLFACQNQDDRIDTFVYSNLTSPSYMEINPVRYLDENEYGKYNGWQDFGSSGEIRTIPIPMGTTYTYQMYSYYIRNDLQLLYGDIALPNDYEDIPEWISDVKQEGSRILWYSMGRNLPNEVSLTHSEIISSDDLLQTFIKAIYQIKIEDQTQNWVIYFMSENGKISSFGIRANENIDFVQSLTDTIIKTYKIKETTIQ